jgi:hypothetical protein
MSDALADAARLLIAEASPTTVRAVLRMLLDEPAPAKAGVAPAASAAATSPTVRSPPLSPTAARTGRKHAARRTSANGADPDWDDLRQQVRAAMREQGIDFTTLGTALGVAPSSARVAIYRKQAPSRPLAAKLQAWLADTSAAEVATLVAPFRGRSQCGNGSSAAVATVPASA